MKNMLYIRTSFEKHIYLLKILYCFRFFLEENHSALGSTLEWAFEFLGWGTSKQEVLVERVLAINASQKSIETLSFILQTNIQNTKAEKSGKKSSILKCFEYLIKRKVLEIYCTTEDGTFQRMPHAFYINLKHDRSFSAQSCACATPPAFYFHHLLTWDGGMLQITSALNGLAE